MRDSQTDLKSRSGHGQHDVSLQINETDVQRRTFKIRNRNIIKTSFDINTRKKDQFLYTKFSETGSASAHTSSLVLPHPTHFGQDKSSGDSCTGNESCLDISLSPRKEQFSGYYDNVRYEKSTTSLSRWMRHYTVRDMRFWDVTLPGSHNSASWCLARNKENRWGGLPLVFLRMYILCQDKTIFQQLRMGIRFLDIRVCKYSSKHEEIYCAHGGFRTIPLKDVLHQIARFCACHKSEVVVLSIRKDVAYVHGPLSVGIVESDSLVASVLVKFLGPELSDTITIRELTERSQNILYFYEDRERYFLSPKKKIKSIDGKRFLWPQSYGKKVRGSTTMEDNAQCPSVPNKVNVCPESGTIKVEGKEHTDMLTKTPNEDMLTQLNIESYETAQLFEWSEPGETHKNTLWHPEDGTKVTLKKTEDGWSSERRWSDPEIHCMSTIPQLQTCYNVNSTFSHHATKKNKENIFFEKYISKRSEKNKKKMFSQLSRNLNDFFLPRKSDLSINSSQCFSLKEVSTKSQYASACSKKSVSHSKKAHDIHFCERERSRKNFVESLCSDTLPTTACQEDSYNRSFEDFKFFIDFCEPSKLSPNEHSSTLKRSKPRIFSNTSFRYIEDDILSHVPKLVKNRRSLAPLSDHILHFSDKNHKELSFNAQHSEKHKQMPQAHFFLAGHSRIVKSWNLTCDPQPDALCEKLVQWTLLYGSPYPRKPFILKILAGEVTPPSFGSPKAPMDVIRFWTVQGAAALCFRNGGLNAAAIKTQRVLLTNVLKRSMIARVNGITHDFVNQSVISKIIKENIKSHSLFKQALIIEKNNKERLQEKFAVI
ncbi:uncharacterized protein LOC128884424 isoform X2 [Hylaeus volcanicus]|uniref:uncharacterized protein LOC128884424 isoform X2 n=1 Tax=Hylaeus volcanicus TaxID=313075 RepID=UPI0023B82EEB|nr:uncharacterized protein LOC128884424 isoform X2 [Hylaeus volcanicus]